MAGRFKKILAFAAVAGAACAGIYYFFIRDTKGALEDGSGNKESEIKKFFEDIPSREYVPLSKGEADPEEEKAPEASDDPKEEKQVLDSDEEKASLDTEGSKKAKE